MEKLLVDPMLPDLLLRSRRIRARPQNSLHLLDASEENLARHEPANSLGARWARQATLIRPELVEEEDALQRGRKVQRHGLKSVEIVEADDRR